MWRDCGLERKVRIVSRETESPATSREAGEQEQHLEWWETQIYLGNLGNPPPPRTSLTLTVRLGRGPPQFPRIIFVGVPHHSGYYSWGSPSPQAIAGGGFNLTVYFSIVGRWGWIKKLPRYRWSWNEGGCLLPGASAGGGGVKTPAAFPRYSFLVSMTMKNLLEIYIDVVCLTAYPVIFCIVVCSKTSSIKFVEKQFVRVA